MKHAHLKDRDMFYKLAWRMRQPRDRATLADDNWTVIVPAFVISELKEAFQIGFILFIPFLVVDMVVANILMALDANVVSNDHLFAIQNSTLRACRWLVFDHPRPCYGLFLRGGRNGRANSRLRNSVHQ